MGKLRVHVFLKKTNVHGIVVGFSVLVVEPFDLVHKSPHLLFGFCSEKMRREGPSKV
jgi:hypothetical protein